MVSEVPTGTESSTKSLKNRPAAVPPATSGAGPGTRWWAGVDTQDMSSIVCGVGPAYRSPAGSVMVRTTSSAEPETRSAAASMDERAADGHLG